MSEKKTLKRAVKSVWDQVKLLRSERAKLYGPDEIRAASDQLGQYALELKELANQLSSLSAMALPANDGEGSPPKRKRDAPRAKK